MKRMIIEVETQKIILKINKRRLALQGDKEEEIMVMYKDGTLPKESFLQKYTRMRRLQHLRNYVM